MKELFKTLSGKIRSWARTEAAKLRGLPFKKKLEYIFSYYWRWMLLFLIFLMFCGYVGEAVAQSHKEVVLEGFFTNDDWNLFPAERIMEEYGATLDLNRKQSLLFDDTLYVTMDGTATEYGAASNGKIIAYMATQELDFIVTTREVYEHYLGNVPMADLETALDPALKERLEGYFVPGQDSEGNPCYTGLDMGQSRFMAGSPYAEEAGQYILFIPLSAPHLDRINDFIDWSFSP